LARSWFRGRDQPSTGAPQHRLDAEEGVVIRVVDGALPTADLGLVVGETATILWLKGAWTSSSSTNALSSG
jgi:hypothetical protein